MDFYEHQLIMQKCSVPTGDSFSQIDESVWFHPSLFAVK